MYHYCSHLCEDGEEVGDASVRDPHLAAVKDPVLPVVRQDGARTD